MRFHWSEEQRLLRAALQKYLDERCGFEGRRMRIEGGFSVESWDGLAGLGVLGLPFEDRYGGSDGSALDTLIVMEALGRGLVVEPFLATVVLGGGLLRQLASDEQKNRLLPALISGQLRLAFAFAEQESRFNLSNVRSRASLENDKYVLNGSKIVVYGAPECHSVLISARSSGNFLDRDGISVFLVPRETPGLTLRDYRALDGMAAAELTISNVRVPRDDLIGPPGGALPAIERVIDEAVAAACGEAVGIMGALNEKCIEFAKRRKAFGQPIANFQVIGHRLVDMQVAYEQAAAITLRAASKLATGAPDSARAVAACKVKVNQEAGFVGKAAVQLHGAMGMTDELDIGHYFKRLLAIQTMFGNADHHLRRYIALEGSDGR
jgi:alkylation response protein AidB-like acyl-CoA dehydrogenase